MVEDVTLDGLTNALKRRSLNLWQGSLPSFLLCLALLDGALLALGRAGISRIFIWSGPATATSVGLYLGLFLNIALLAGAWYCRGMSSAAGVLPEARGAGGAIDWPKASRAAVRLGPAPTGSARFMFLTALGIAAALCGLVVLESSLPPIAIPFAAAIVAATAAALAWTVTASTFLGDGRSGLLGFGAAVLLSLLFQAGMDSTGLSTSAALFGLVMMASAISVLIMIAVHDPAREAVVRLVSWGSYPDGIFPWHPQHLDGGRAYLEFAPDSRSSIVAFIRPHLSASSETPFRAVDISDIGAPTPLHEQHLWLWNLRMLTKDLPRDVDLNGRDNLVTAKAEIVCRYGAASVGPGRIVRQRALRAAAENLLSGEFSGTMVSSLKSSFNEDLLEIGDKVQKLVREISGAPDEIASWEAPFLSKFPLDEAIESEIDARMRSLESYMRKASEFESKLDSLMKRVDELEGEACQLSNERSVRISHQWRDCLSRDLANFRADDMEVDLEEARFFISLINPTVTIAEARAGESFAQARKLLADVRPKLLETKRHLEERYESSSRELRQLQIEEIAHKRDIEKTIVTALANDPIGRRQMVWSQAEGLVSITHKPAATELEAPDDAASRTSRRRQKPRPST